MWNGSAAYQFDETLGPRMSAALSDSRSVERPSVPGETQDAFSKVWTPAWIESAKSRLLVLSRLEDDWDTYGARRIPPANINAALYLLTALCGPNTPEPSIVPTAAGGLQMEWHEGGLDLEIEMRSPTELAVFFEDAAAGLDREFPLTYDLAPLAELIARLPQ